MILLIMVRDMSLAQQAPITPASPILAELNYEEHVIKVFTPKFSML